MSAPAPSTPGTSAVHAPVAFAERRFQAFVIDRLIAWSLVAVAGVVAWRRWWADGDLWPGLGLVLGVLVAVGLALALGLGVTGATPGKALLGLRVVDHGTGTPIGLGPALLRTLVLGAATWPTFGLGTAVLAWSALVERHGQRRGLHDRAAHAIVVDVRPSEAVVREEDEAAPRHVVNLTAMRLMPPSPAQPRVPAQAPEARPMPRAPWRITLDTGESVVVTGMVLLGRGPQPRPGEQVQETVRLRSEDMSVSKTHAQVHVARDGALVVVDRGSTNGSVLVRRGMTRELVPGRPTTLVNGDRVRLGDRELVVDQVAGPPPGVSG